jgi:uncharacterized membrane protein
MMIVTLYTRQDCHLCQQTVADLEALQTMVPHELKLVDVDSDPQLLKQYGTAIPVVVAGPYTLKAPIERMDLEITLRAVQQSTQEVASIDSRIASGEISLGLAWSKADEFSLWLSHHYLAVVNWIVIAYLGMAFLAPVLMKVGAVAPAQVIYKLYGYVCHQLPYRSWFLFGQQAAYPRSAAHIDDLQTFNQVTGLSEDATAEAIWTVREYEGDAHNGYKVALCERDVAIYSALILFGLVFSQLRNRPGKKPFPALHWLLWIALGILPMGLDGGTQLISQFMPFINRWLPFRESTPFLRTLTGGLFGITTAWFSYPMLDESFQESLRMLYNKRRRIELETQARQKRAAA